MNLVQKLRGVRLVTVVLFVSNSGLFGAESLPNGHVSFTQPVQNKRINLSGPSSGNFLNLKFPDEKGPVDKGDTPR